MKIQNLVQKKPLLLFYIILATSFLMACSTDTDEYAEQIDTTESSETEQIDDDDYDIVENDHDITEPDVIDEHTLSADIDIVLIEGDDRTQLWEEDITRFATTIKNEFPLFRDQSSRIETSEDWLSWNLNETFTSFPSASLIYMLDADLLQDFDDMINDLISRIPYLGDFEIVMGLSRALALTGDSHTSFFFPRSYGIPLALGSHFDEQHSETSYPFPWPHITGAYVGIDSVVNTRLLEINGVEMSEIFDRMRPLFPHDNEVSLRALFSVNALFKEILQYIGIINDEDVVPITVRDVNGNIFTVDAPLMPANNVPTFGERVIYRQNTDGEMTHHIMDTEEFFAWEPNARNTWYRFFPEENMMYLRSSLSEEPGSIVAYQGVIETITEQGGVDIFVVDLRGNIGGSPLEGLYRFRNWARAEENRALLGAFYVVVDTATFSMGVIEAYMFRNFLEDVILIGEPPAGGLNIFFGMNQARLQNSRVVWYRNRFGSLLDPDNEIETNTLYPDISVYRTLEDYINNHDAVIETILIRHGVTTE